MPQLQAVIFDLDGTLVDTEAVWTIAQTRWMAAHGKTYEASFQKELMGRPGIENVRLIRERYDIRGDDDALIAERKKYFRETFDEIGFVPKPGARELIAALAEADVKIGLATAAEREYAERALASLGCRSCFVAVTCGEDVKNGKPHPDIFLTAAQRVGVEPIAAVGVEDSPSGVASAKSAGLKVVGVADPRYLDALPNADLQVRTLSDVTPQTLQQLFD
ncbi:MAG: HAD family phosphatase [Patescibacteria group bacterium]